MYSKVAFGIIIPMKSKGPDAPKRAPQGSQTLRRLGFVLVISSFLWGTVLAAGMRSWEYGSSWRTLGAALYFALLFATPLTFIGFCFLARRWRSRLGLTLATLLVMILIGLAWMETEEYSFRREVQAGTSTWRARWWPFDGGSLYYSPEGRYGAHD